MHRNGHRESKRGSPIVLLDLSLPRMPGLEVLRQMKAEQHTQHIHVIVLSASRRDGDFREALRLGAETCLIKPVEFQDFCAVTHKLSFDWTLLQPANVP